MRLCTNCGVELEENMNFCPLCGEPVSDERTGNRENIEVRNPKQQEKQVTAYQKLSRLQRRKLFWKISGILLFSGIVITLAIDLLGDDEISWSRYPIVACATVFVYITLFSFWPHKSPLLLAGTYLSTSALLILLDMFDGDLDWGIKLGAPLLLVTYFIMIVLVLVIRNAKGKALNLVAYSLSALGLLCICIEGIISLYTQGILKFHWSLVATVSVLPVIVLLLFIHHRIKKGADLRRFFHI